MRLPGMVPAELALEAPRLAVERHLQRRHARRAFEHVQLRPDQEGRGRVIAGPGLAGELGIVQTAGVAHALDIRPALKDGDSGRHDRLRGRAFGGFLLHCGCVSIQDRAVQPCSKPANFSPAARIRCCSPMARFHTQRHDPANRRRVCAVPGVGRNWKRKARIDSTTKPMARCASLRSTSPP